MRISSRGLSLETFPPGCRHQDPSQSLQLNACLEAQDCCTSHRPKAWPLKANFGRGKTAHQILSLNKLYNKLVDTGASQLDCLMQQLLETRRRLKHNSTLWCHIILTVQSTVKGHTSRSRVPSSNHLRAAAAQLMSAASMASDWYRCALGRCRVFLMPCNTLSCRRPVWQPDT